MWQRSLHFPLVVFSFWPPKYKFSRLQIFNNQPTARKLSSQYHCFLGPMWSEPHLSVKDPDMSRRQSKLDHCAFTILPLPLGSEYQQTIKPFQTLSRAFHRAPCLHGCTSLSLSNGACKEKAKTARRHYR